MISPEAPYPLDGGGALRTASLMHYLAEHYELDLIVFRHPGQKIGEYLPPGLVRCARTIDLRPHRRDLLSRAIRNGVRVLKESPPLVDRFGGYDREITECARVGGYDVTVLEHFWAASYVPLVRRFSRRVVVDLHNVESFWHAGCARVSRFPHNLVHRWFAKAARRRELDWLHQCDLALTASSEDARRIADICAGLAVRVYPNAIPWRDRLNTESDLSIAFSGNLEYEPNRDGLRSFLGNVWPALKSRFPALTFRIIGKNAHAISEDVRSRPDVECTGAVEDPFVHISAARVCIAPLLSGSGTRLKIIEAWAAQRPVVSTRIGAEGLGAEDGQSILLADAPGDFADAVSKLLDEKELREKIAVGGRGLYEQKFTWNRAWATLEGAL